MTQAPDDRLTRQEACEALGIAPDAFERLESLGILKADPDGLYHPLAIAASATAGATAVISRGSKGAGIR